MRPIAHVSLTSLLSMRLQASARLFVRVETEESLVEALELARRLGLPPLILGGGSNLVVCGEFPGLCIALRLRGVEILYEDSSTVVVEVATGESLDGLITLCLEYGWYGLEALSMIPGSVGATPVQNVGAYGTSIKDVLQEVRVLDKETMNIDLWSREDCALDYRSSCLRATAGRYIVTAVRLKLSKNLTARVDHPAVAKHLRVANGNAVSAESLATAVRVVRSSHLPNPESAPNVGSFFINPVVGKTELQDLRGLCPDIPYKSLSDGTFRVSAGHLIERAGWRGKSHDSVRVSPQHALVLVNEGRATGGQVLALADRIRDDIAQKFDVILAREPSVV